jgi:hypothetical protein
MAAWTFVQTDGSCVKSATYEKLRTGEVLTAGSMSSSPVYAIALLPLPESQDTWNPDSKKGRSLGRIGGRIELLVPAVGGYSQILWVFDVIKTIDGGVCRIVWDNVVLYNQKEEGVKIGRVQQFHRTN